MKNLLTLSRSLVIFASYFTMNTMQADLFKFESKPMNALLKTCVDNHTPAVEASSYSMAGALASTQNMMEEARKSVVNAGYRLAETTSDVAPSIKGLMAENSSNTTAPTTGMFDGLVSTGKGMWNSGYSVVESGMQSAKNFVSTNAVIPDVMQNSASSVASLVSSYPKSTIAASIIALYGTYYWWVLRDRMAIGSIERELAPKNAMKTDGLAIIEIHNWKNQEYPTASAIKSAENAVVSGLVEDAMSGKLVGFVPTNYNDMNNGLLHRQAALGIEKVLSDEIRKLDKKLDALRVHISNSGFAFSKYIGFKNNLGSIDYTSELEVICDRIKANINDPSTWTNAQERAIDQHMINAAVTTKTNFVRGYSNYGQAAALYWNVFKKRSRLIAIKQALVKDARFLNMNVRYF